MCRNDLKPPRSGQRYVPCLLGSSERAGINIAESQKRAEAHCADAMVVLIDPSEAATLFRWPTSQLAPLPIVGMRSTSLIRTCPICDDSTKD